MELGEETAEVLPSSWPKCRSRRFCHFELAAAIDTRVWDQFDIVSPVLDVDDDTNASYLKIRRKAQESSSKLLSEGFAHCFLILVSRMVD